MPAELLDEFSQLTSAYAPEIEYEANNIIKLYADNGTAITQAVENSSFLGNGSAFNVSSITSTVAAGATSALSAGYALGALEIPAAGAMLIPALGLGAGTLLYNLAPDFWTNVSNKLVDAGKTIGGKLACFFNQDGKTLIDADAINIFKNELIANGYYSTNNEVNISELNLNNLWYNYSNIKVFKYNLPINFISTDSNNGTVYHFYSNIEDNTNSSNVYWSILEYDSTKELLFFSYEKFTPIVYYYNNQKITVSPLNATINDDKKTNVYYNFSKTKISSNNYIITETNIAILQPNSSYTTPKLSADYAYLALNGNISSNDYQETNAIIPSANQSIIETFGNNIQIENIPTTVPNEYIQAIPIEIPELNPATTQEQALNPDSGTEAVIENNPSILSPIVTWIKDNIILPQPITNPDIDPQPLPTPDPDPQPNPDPIPETNPTNEQNNPINPNSDPTVPATPLLPVLPATVSSNKLFTVYNPTISQLNALGTFLWSSDIIDALKRIWQNPLDSVISLRQIFCNPITGSSSNIILGTLDSGVSSLVVTEQFVTYECGSISLNEFFKNATDYSPYTQVHLYLPFIGIVEINVNEFMNGSISITYHFDVYTGAVLTEVKCTRNPDIPNATILYTFTGNASQALPVTASNYQGAINATIGVATGALTLASGGGLSPIFAMGSIAHSLTHEMVHINHASSLSGNAGIMGSRYPQLIVSRRKSFDANSYNDFYGYPTNKTVYLSNCSGYTRIKSIHINSVATQDEKNEIESLLKEGVLL